jgi:CRISPR system Cascade subunit CasB
MADKSQADRIYELVKRKNEMLKNDSAYARATLARLRRGVGVDIGNFPDAWDVLLDGLDDDMTSRDGTATRSEIAIYTALTLFAVHQQGKYPAYMGGGKDSFGAAVKRLIAPDGSNASAVKRRFDTVITSGDYKELSHHARGLINLLRSKDVPLNYARFAKDIYWFQFPDVAGKIKLSWGEDYYRRPKADQKEKEDTAK